MCACTCMCMWCDMAFCLRMCACKCLCVHRRAIWQIWPDLAWRRLSAFIMLFLSISEIQFFFFCLLASLLFQYFITCKNLKLSFFLIYFWWLIFFIFFILFYAYLVSNSYTGSGRSALLAQLRVVAERSGAFFTSGKATPPDTRVSDPVSEKNLIIKYVNININIILGWYYTQW